MCRGAIAKALPMLSLTGGRTDRQEIGHDAVSSGRFDVGLVHLRHTPCTINMSPDIQHANARCIEVRGIPTSPLMKITNDLLILKEMIAWNLHCPHSLPRIRGSAFSNLFVHPEGWALRVRVGSRVVSTQVGIDWVALVFLDMAHDSLADHAVARGDWTCPQGGCIGGRALKTSAKSFESVTISTMPVRSNARVSCRGTLGTMC